jgi:DinB superfamily
MKSILVASLLLSALTAARAQSAPAPRAQAATPPAAAPVANPVMTVLRQFLPQRQKAIVGAIEVMPADKFSYKPTPDQISFGHLAAHIAESNNGACARIAGIPAPKVDELKETDPKDKLLAAVKASFEFCSTALANVDDSKLGEVLDYGRLQGPRAMAVFFLAGGWADHYAAAAMYLRLNGILPPTAQPKK